MQCDQIGEWREKQSTLDRFVRWFFVFLTPALVWGIFAAPLYALGGALAISLYAIFLMFPATIVICAWLLRPDKLRAVGTWLLVVYGVTFLFWGYLAGLAIIPIAGMFEEQLGFDGVVVFSGGVGGSLVSTALLALWTRSWGVTLGMLFATLLVGVLAHPVFHLYWSPQAFRADGMTLPIIVWHLVTALVLATWGLRATPRPPLTQGWFR